MIFGELEIVIARELTKIYEEARRGKLSEFQAFYSNNPPKGEITVLFHL